MFRLRLQRRKIQRKKNSDSLCKELFDIGIDV